MGDAGGDLGCESGGVVSAWSDGGNGASGGTEEGCGVFGTVHLGSAIGLSCSRRTERR